MKFLPKGVTLAGALENNSPLEVWSSHVRRLWPIYLGGSLAVIFTNVADVMIPRYVATAIDTLTQRRLPSFSELYAPLLMFLFLAFIGRIYWRRLLGQQTHFVAARLRSLLWDRARFFSKDRLQGDLSPGELMNMATSDIGIARFMFGFTLVGTVDFLFLTILSLASMWLMDPTLTLATLIVFPAVPFLVHRLAQREEQDHRTAQDSLAQLTDLAAQAIATQRLQRVSQTHQFWEEKLKQAAEDYCWKHYRVAKTSLAFIPATGFAPLVAFGILLALGIQKVLSGQLSIGEFVALQSYIFLVQQPMLELGVIVSEWQRAHASLDRVLKTLRTPEVPGLRTGGVSTEIQELVYRVENLHYRIPGTDRVLLENLSFSLKRGDRLGVTGPIGCGKSTLLEILSGLETRYTGNIELWGRPIAEYAHDSLRRRLAIVPQRPFLFNDTIRSNVQMHREELSDADIWHWLEVAGVREDVEAFPERLDTRLGEWGVNLSGGQKQRLTLARALAGRPDVLLLDDCLSAVDTLTEERILAALDRELAQTTLIWVAHRPSTLKHCTRWLNLAPTRHTS